MNYENKRANLRLPMLITGQDRKFTAREGSAVGEPPGRGSAGSTAVFTPGWPPELAGSQGNGSASEANTEAGSGGTGSFVVVVVCFLVWVLNLLSSLNLRNAGGHCRPVGRS